MPPKTDPELDFLHQILSQIPGMAPQPGSWLARRLGVGDAAASDATRVSKQQLARIQQATRTAGAALPGNRPLPAGRAQELNPNRPIEKALGLLHEFGPTGAAQMAWRAGQDFGDALPINDLRHGSDLPKAGGALVAGALAAGFPEGEGAAAGEAIEKLAGRVAKRNLRKEAVTAVNLREMTTSDALAAARRGVHLKQNAKTAEYVGAPAFVNSPGSLAKMRRDFDALVEQGAIGGDWYDRTRGGIRQATRTPEQAGLFADELALTSPQADPEPNLQFALQAHNGYQYGAPEPIVRTGPVAERYKAARDANAPIPLGPKTAPYGAHINPEVPPPTTAVNDFRHARNFGYTETDGSPITRGLTAQEHSFMDAETLLAMDRANAKGLAGRTNWTVEQVQAAPWVLQKAQDLAGRHFGIEDVSKLTQEQLQWGLEKAAKTYTDHFPKHTAFGTYEHVPGAGTGHLEGLLGAPYAVREAYGAAAPWTDAGGHDILYGALGTHQLPTNKATGFYKNPAGVIETNPAYVARPLVELADDASGKTIGPKSQSAMTKVEGTRAYFDAQNMGAWHKMFPEGSPGFKAGAGTSATVPLNGPLTEAQMKALAPIADAHGFGVSDTGQGLSLMNFNGDQSAKNIKATLQPSHPLGGALAQEFGPSSAQRARFVGVPVDDSYTPVTDFSNALAQPHGSGAATRQLFGLLDDPTTPSIEGMISDSPEVRERVARAASRDEAYAGMGHGVTRADMQNARRIFAAGGFPALRAALARGELLPAVVGALGLGGLLSAGVTGERPGGA